MSAQAVARINWLLERYADPSYLEVGVYRGGTFFGVNAALKVAVDPQFRFELPADAPGTQYCQVTSDQFFADLDPDKVFDVIFLDGFHNFEQTLRDFCNAIAHSHLHSIIIIDDTVPNDPYSTIRDQRTALNMRAAHGLQSKSWHGDVYKTVFAIHDFFQGFSYATVMDDGNPQTVVWRQPRSVTPAFDNVQDIGQADYFAYHQNKHLFNPVTHARLKQIIDALPRP